MLSIWIVAVLVQGSAASPCTSCTAFLAATPCAPDTVPAEASGGSCPTVADATLDNCCTACNRDQHGTGAGRNIFCMDCHIECIDCNSRSECEVCAQGSIENGAYVKTAKGTCDYTCHEGFKLAMTMNAASATASAEPLYERDTLDTHKCEACYDTNCAKCIGITGPLGDGTDAAARAAAISGANPGTDKCTQCKSGYVMPPGCPSCEAELQTAGVVPTCSADCDAGFSKHNNKCKECKANCNACNADGTCTAAKDGFFIVAADNALKKCGLNVKTCVEQTATGWATTVTACNANDAALGWSEGYEFGLRTFTASTTYPGAGTGGSGDPTGNRNCDITCGDTFYVDAASNACKRCYTSNGITCACTAGPAASQCLVGATGTCPEGKFGYTGTAGALGTCTSCEAGYKSCSAAASGTCDDGYAASGNSPSSTACAACTATGCKTCAPASTCTVCADGKTLKGSGATATCESCGVANCKECAYATKDTVCTTCTDGYAGEMCDRKCASSLTECSSCTRGGHFCKLCSDGSDPRGVSHSCSHASMNGDPHVTNLRGEKFDVMQSGKHSLICLPRGHCGKMNDLHVQVTVARLSGGSCESAFVQDVTLNGKWVGEAITISAGTLRSQKTFGVHGDKFYSFKDIQKAGLTKNGMGKTMTIVAVKSHRETIAADFGGVKVSVEHVSHPHLSFLNVNAQGLLAQDVEVGGLLGLDGHKEAATAPDGCKHKVRAHRGESDTLASELIGN